MYHNPDDSITDAKLSLDSVYTVWTDFSLEPGEIFYKRNTISFDPTAVLSISHPLDTSPPFDPAIAANKPGTGLNGLAGNYVHVVWEDNLPVGTPPHIFYSRSTDGGADFPGSINQLSPFAVASFNPDIATGTTNDNVYVVWEEGPEGDHEIFFRRSTTGGSGFSSSINLSNNDGDSTLPAIAAAGDNVYGYRCIVSGNDNISVNVIKDKQRISRRIMAITYRRL